jgi:tetratricopeptide (TPR) repeat protein
MSELKSLLREAKHNLRDLESLLHKANSLDQNQSDQYVLSREELQKYFEEMLKILESLPENLKVEEGFEDKKEIRNLHLQMEEVRRKVEECFGRVEAACETNLHELSQFIENLCISKVAQIEESNVLTKTPCLTELLSQGKAHLENEEFEACVKKMNQVLSLAPGNVEASSLIVEAQKKSEELRLEEELVVHIENLKKEAMDQFDKEQYHDCLRTFKFLCEMEPKNRTLQDYHELSRQKVQEMEDVEPKSGGTSGPVTEPETNLKASILASKSSVQPSLTTEVKTQDAPAITVRGFEATVDNSTPLPPAQTQVTAPKPFENLTKIATQDRPEALQEEATPATNQKTMKVWIAMIGAAALAFVAMVGQPAFLKHPPKPVVTTFEIQSEPEAAQVFIDGQLKGQTRLKLDSLTEGQHQLRVEMDGYAPLTQSFALSKDETSSLSVRLAKLAPPAETQTNPLEIAQTLFDQGSFIEASRNCDLVLQNDTQNAPALELKAKIRSLYLHQSSSAVSKGRWEEARAALENALKVSPSDSEATRQLKFVRTQLKKPTVAADPGDAQLASRIQDLHQQIAAAINAATYLPPTSHNAVELIHQLSNIAPTDTFAKEKLDQVNRELLNQIQRKIQAKDFDGAKILVQQVQAHLPETPELKNLRDAVKLEESKLMETWSSLLQKAESSMAAGRYVTPSGDNAVVYANRLLAIDSQNPRAIALKKDSLTKATAQAKEFVQSEKFDEARDAYFALLQLSSSESHSGLNAIELKRDLEKIEFATYPVVHVHSLMGSCTGRLRVNAYVMSFIPSGNSKDGFTEKLADIEVESPGDKLKLQVRNKTYRYEANLVKSKEENREKLEAIYQRLSELKAKAK